MDTIIFDIVTYYIIAILFIIIVLTLMQTIKKKLMKNEIRNLEIKKNQIIDSVILGELNKLEKLAKKDTLIEKHKDWNTKIENIKQTTLKDITELLLEADYLVDSKKFTIYKEQKVKIELKIYEAIENRAKIFTQIQEITLCEEKNRNIITQLKIRYRKILNDYEELKEEFGEVRETVKLQIENIEKRFLDFERLLENQDYEETNLIIGVLSSMISHMEVVIDELPSAILMATNLIPKRMDEILLNYNKLVNSGFQLDYLNVEYNIEETKKKIEDIMSKIRMLNLEEVIFELKVILDYFDSMFNDFEREKADRKTFDNKLVSFKIQSKKLKDSIETFNNKNKDVNYKYKLTKDQLFKLSELDSEYNSVNKDFDILCDTKQTTSFPYSRLLKELEILIIKLSKLNEKINSFADRVGDLQEDEKRAREQYIEISNILKTAKLKIKTYNFPKIPTYYFVYLNEAIEALKELNGELYKKPLNMEVLNTRVDTARDLVFKFSNTINELLKTAIMAEKTIIYGNRYRSEKASVNEGLNKAETLFFNGEYKKSLELSLNTIDLVEHGIYKKLLNLYEKN